MLVASLPSMRTCPEVTSSSPAISRRSVDLPQPDGPTNTANSPSLMSRSTPLITLTAPNALVTDFSWMLPMIEFSLFPGYFTAPKVRPRTSCFCENQPRMRIGAMASVEAADSFAQKNPSGAEYEAMKAVSGAALDVARLSVQNASFHDRMIASSIVEAMPGTDIGVKT